MVTLGYKGKSFGENLKVFSGHKLKLRDTEWLIKAFMTQSRLGSLF